MKYKGMNVWLSSNIVTKLKAEQYDDERLIETLHRLLGVAMPMRMAKEPELKSLADYDLSDLEIGSVKTIPWRKNNNGVLLDQRPIHNSIQNYSQKTGRIFKTNYEQDGVRVTRLE